nr:rootletin-like isoform X2 [Cherax quadricarinatus]
MFGFFKSKNKDKSVGKDKNSDANKDKKKEKESKEEKDTKVAIRKGKEEKISKSIFRKSKSIERVKVTEEAVVPSKKSKTLGARGSGGWTDSDHDDPPCQDDAAAGGYDTPPPRNSSSSFSSDGVVCSSSSSLSAQLPGNPCFGGSAGVDQPSSGNSVVSSLCKQDSRLNSEREETRKLGQNSWGIPAGCAVEEATVLSRDTEEQDCKDLKVMSGTTATLSTSSSPLVMKPPLNPRVVAPRGPLATSGLPPNQQTEVMMAVEKEESRYTPSPSLITPPSSPGMPCAQVVPPYPAVTGPSSRPTSPDGRTSMLSTPSSSTSSLSSLTARPISPSGRRTPPGPRLGTGGRLTSSPTSGRKAVRTNIKTNPTVVSRRAGSRSPVNPPPSPSPSTTTDTAVLFIDGDKLKTPPASPDTTRHVSSDHTCGSEPEVQNSVSPPNPIDVSVTPKSSPPSTVPETTTQLLSSAKAKTQLPLATVKPGLSSSPSPPPTNSLPCEVKPETGSKLTPRSVSPTAGKSRHSISSMHSLESIPENDSEGQTSASDTLEKARKSKGVLGTKSSYPLHIGREIKESGNKDLTTYSTRHSVPEVSSGGTSHGSSHKRSSSLTPVNEERFLHSSAANNHHKIPQNVNSSVSPGATIRYNGPVTDATKQPEKYSFENSTSKGVSLQNARGDQRHLSQRDEISTRMAKSCGVRPTQSENRGMSQIIFQTPVEESTLLVQRKLYGGDDEKPLEVSLLTKQPIIASLTTVVESGIMKADANKEVNSKTEEASIREPVQSNKNPNVSTISEATTATHVVFRIPLRSSSLTNGKGTQRRVSAEILSKEDGKTHRKDKEHRRERPRSLSTSRELKRENTSEVFERRRLLSEGAECEEDLSMERGRGVAKDEVRERVRRRSSSSIRRRRSRGEENHHEKDNGNTMSNDNKEYDEVLVPWRTSTRSRTRASGNGTKGTVMNTTVSNDKNSCGTNDLGEGSTVRHRTRSASTGRRARETQENNDGNDFLTTSINSSIAPPPRQRSKSRGSERRLTRSVTQSEIKHACDMNMKPMSPERDSKSRSRTQSASRIADTSRYPEDVNTSGRGRPMLDGDAAGAHKPPRRRSLSTSRRRSEVLRDVDESLVPHSARSKSLERKDTNRALSRKQEMEVIIAKDSNQLTDSRNGNADNERKIDEVCVINDINKTDIGGAILKTGTDKNNAGIYDSTNVKVTSARLRKGSSKDEDIAANEEEPKSNQIENTENDNKSIQDANQKIVKDDENIYNENSENEKDSKNTDIENGKTENDSKNTDIENGKTENDSKNSNNENRKTANDNKKRNATSVEVRSVQLQTQETTAASKTCQTEDDATEATRLLQEALGSARKELADQEERYQKQVDQLTISLAEKQQEVAALTRNIETLKGAQETLNNSEELQEKLALLQQDVRDRSAQMDCLRVELQYSKNEVELTKSKLKKLEEDLDAARQKNVALQNQITATANCDRTEELEKKIENLEETLKAAQEERDKLSKTIEEIETERDEEIKIIQDALDEAAQEREELINTFEKELQNMNTMNSTREQQLMEDFEWKLREMEKDHKKKLEERDRKAEERITAMRNIVESELADSLIKVAEDRRIADEQLAEVGHLKSYEAEAIQLRGVTHELQKALRASAREMEHLKMRERILEEEIRGLKKAPPNRQVGQSTLHRVKRQAEEAEAEFRQKQEKMKNELNAEWEDKLRSECSRLKAELDDLHAEEKHLAVESMKVQKEQEIRALKQSWELRQEEMTKEISTLKDSLTDKDAYYHKELENMRTNADRDVWELRRKLQRLDEKNWTQQEYLQEKHHEEMERLRADYKERVSDLEALLAVAMKNSDEESRVQAEKMHNDEMEHLCEQHRLSMERLREELEAEKFQAVEEARVIVSKHLEYINATLRDQLAEALTNSTQYREELEAVKSALTLREEVISSLEEELAKLKEVEGAGPSPSYTASQTSLASTSESSSSQGSNSQDRLSLSESVGLSVDSQDDAHKSGCG